jgi:hypothetical protein
MPRETLFMRDAYAAKYERTSRDETVNIVANADAERGNYRCSSSRLTLIPNPRRRFRLPGLH